MAPNVHETFARMAEKSAYQLIDPPILQPADLFLDLIGEDIRRRAFLITDGDGHEFCLRPDFTIPVSLHHLKTRGNRSIGAYAYCGPVFRFRPGESGEFTQAGFENFGRRDVEAADAEMLGLALEAACDLDLKAPLVRMGDAGLVEAMLDALNLPPVWRRRLEADLKRSKHLDADLIRLGEGGSVQGVQGTAAYAGFLAALEGAGHERAKAAVIDLLAIAGIQPVGGRSIGEIADRFLEQATLSSGGGIPSSTIQLLRRFFAVAADPDQASVELRAIANDGGLDMAKALDRFDLRAGFLAAAGIDVSAIAFSTGFGRGLDYYTGFMFELYESNQPDGQPLIGGGRYDRLLSQLGSPESIPAVGCSVWLDRFAAVRS